MTDVVERLSSDDPRVRGTAQGGLAAEVAFTAATAGLGTAARLDRPVGGSQSQNDAAQADIALLRNLGAINIRVNQQQLTTGECRVGICRPDVQATLPAMNGQPARRIIIEYDTSASTRGTPHGIRRRANDPNAIIILRRVN